LDLRPHADHVSDLAVSFYMLAFVGLVSVIWRC